MEVAAGDEIVTVDLPDRSGELLKHMLDARVWEPDLHHQISLAAGAMLFLRADATVPDDRADAFAEPLRGAENQPDGGEPSDDVQEPLPWSPALMPADARTVDLLQAVLDARSGALPLAIIISAWDRVSPPAPGPPAWLAQQMPLLEQFLASHRQRLPHAVFGVSAQGGDFTVGLANELAEEDPWDRAFVVRPDEARGTLSEPILWLLETRP